MNIAINYTQEEFGGITTINRGLLSLMKQNGDKVFGLEYSGGRLQETNLNASLDDQSQIVGRGIIACKNIHKLYPWSGVEALKTEYKKQIDDTKKFLVINNIEVVFISGTYFGPWVLSLAAKELGLPVILRYAGVLNKEMVYANVTKNEKTNEYILECERSIAMHATQIIYPSTLCQREVEKSVFKTKMKMGIVIPNPLIHPALEESTVKKVLSDKKRIAFIGRWDGIKNVSAFVNLHHELNKRQYNHQAIVVTDYRDISFAVPESIERVSTMNKLELNQFYKSVDLVVVPSFFETFCNVAAESLLIGTPVLVSESVGIASYLKAAGLERMVIMNFSNIEIAATTVKKLCEKGVTLDEQKTLRKAFDTSEIYTKIIRVIHSVLQS